jgi:hypothetical protein
MTTLPKGDEYQQAVQTPTISFVPPSGPATPVNHPTNKVKVSKLDPISATVISMGSFVGGVGLAVSFQNALFLIVGLGISIYTMARD